MKNLFLTLAAIIGISSTLAAQAFTATASCANTAPSTINKSVYDSVTHKVITYINNFSAQQSVVIRIDETTGARDTLGRALPLAILNIALSKERVVWIVGQNMSAATHDSIIWSNDLATNSDWVIPAVLPHGSVSKVITMNQPDVIMITGVFSVPSVDSLDTWKNIAMYGSGMGYFQVAPLSTSVDTISFSLLKKNDADTVSSTLDDIFIAYYNKRDSTKHLCRYTSSTGFYELSVPVLWDGSITDYSVINDTGYVTIVELPHIVPGLADASYIYNVGDTANWALVDSVDGLVEQGVVFGKQIFYRGNLLDFENYVFSTNGNQIFPRWGEYAGGARPASLFLSGDRLFVSGGGMKYVSGTDTLKNVLVFTITDTATGIRNVPEIAWNLFPNPTSGALFISTEAMASITISNTLGEVVTRSFVPAGLSRIDLNMPTGAYFVSITSANKTATKLVILESGH